MRHPSTQILGLVLGGIYLAFGVAEVATHRNDTALAIAFWGLSLLGGGALVIAGTLLLPTRRRPGLALLTIGTLLGTNATLWTLLLPIFAIYVVVQAYRNHPGHGPIRQRR
jgi:hypothetical protein